MSVNFVCWFSLDEVLTLALILSHNRRCGTIVKNMWIAERFVLVFLVVVDRNVCNYCIGGWIGVYSHAFNLPVTSVVAHYYMLLSRSCFIDEYFSLANYTDGIVRNDWYAYVLRIPRTYVRHFVGRVGLIGAYGGTVWTMGLDSSVLRSEVFWTLWTHLNCAELSGLKCPVTAVIYCSMFKI